MSCSEKKTAVNCYKAERFRNHGKKIKMTHAQPTQKRFIIPRIVNWFKIYKINNFILIIITFLILSGSFFCGNVRSGDGPKLGGFGASVPLSPCCPERSVRILQIFYNVWIKLRTFQRFSKIFRSFDFSYTAGFKKLNLCFWILIFWSLSMYFNW